MSISIIIPAFNEEKSIIQVVKEVKNEIESKSDYEIIIIDDQSKDNTFSLCKKYFKSDSKIFVHQNKKNLGFGGSFKRGLKLSSKNYCVVIPGDGEQDVKSIFAKIDLMYDYDFITFYPYDNKRGFFRIFLSKKFTKICNFFFNLNLKYFNGTTIYKVNYLKKIEINSNGFFFNAEILIKLIKLKKKYKEIPLNTRLRKHGKSSAIKIKNFLEVLKDFIYLFFVQILKY